MVPFKKENIGEIVQIRSMGVLVNGICALGNRCQQSVEHSISFSKMLFTIDTSPAYKCSFFNHR